MVLCYYKNSHYKSYNVIFPNIEKIMFFFCYNRKSNGISVTLGKVIVFLLL